MNIEDCSIININAENTENNKTNPNMNKMFSFDLNDEQQDFNNDFNSNPLNIRETIENEINEKENLDLSFKEKEKEKIPPKEFKILPPTFFDTK